MSEKLLHKTITGIAGEFLVAGKLARRGYNVTLTHWEIPKPLIF